MVDMNQEEILKSLQELYLKFDQNTQQLANNDQMILNFVRVQTNLLYRQIESLFSIYSLFNFRFPLPPMRGWPISPDFGQLLISHILEEKPKLIVECGSGISTILGGYALEKIGQGKIISLDHEKKYTEKTIHQLDLHNLTNNIDVIHAPLQEYQINQSSWQWYTLRAFNPQTKIDLLLVDGPPSTIQKNARYPALPLLRSYFSDEITILVDDAGRKEEKGLLGLWLEEFPEFRFESIETEKGVAILKKQ